MKFVKSLNGYWNGKFYAGNKVYISGKEKILSFEEKERLINEVYKKEIDGSIEECRDKEFKDYLKKRNYSFLFENLSLIRNIITRLNVCEDEFSELYIALLENRDISNFFEITYINSKFVEINEEKIKQAIIPIVKEMVKSCTFFIVKLNADIFVNKVGDICFLMGRLLYIIKKSGIEKIVDADLSLYQLVGKIETKKKSTLR